MIIKSRSRQKLLSKMSFRYFYFISTLICAILVFVDAKNINESSEIVQKIKIYNSSQPKLNTRSVPQRDTKNGTSFNSITRERGERWDQMSTILDKFYEYVARRENKLNTPQLPRKPGDLNGLKKEQTAPNVLPNSRSNNQIEAKESVKIQTECEKDDPVILLAEKRFSLDNYIRKPRSTAEITTPPPRGNPIPANSLSPVRQQSNPTADDNRCTLKAGIENHKSLETQRLQEVKDEVAQLKELVRLLQDQQRILNMLEDISQKPPFAVQRQQSRSDARQTQEEIRTLLDFMKKSVEEKRNKTAASQDGFNNNRNTDELNKISNMQKEVQKLKEIIRKLTPNINSETSQLSQNTQLISELQTQKRQLSALRVMVENVYKLNKNFQNHTFPTAENASRLNNPQLNTSDEAIVSHIPPARSSSIHHFAKPPKAAHILLHKTHPKIDCAKQRYADKTASTSTTKAAPPTIFGQFHDNTLEPKEANMQNVLREAVSDDDKEALKKIIEEAARPDPTSEFDQQLAELEKLLEEGGSFGESADVPLTPPQQGREESDGVLEKLLNMLDDTPKSKSDASTIIETRLIQMEKQLKALEEPKGKNNEVMTQLAKLEKQMEQLKAGKDQTESKSLDDNIAEKLKKIQQRLKDLSKSKPESKDLSGHNDVKSELKNLHEAINKLRPKDEPKDELETEAKFNSDKTDRFKAILSQLISGVKPSLTTAPTSRPHHPTKIEAIKAQIMALKQGQTSHVYPAPLPLIPAYGNYPIANIAYGSGQYILQHQPAQYGGNYPFTPYVDGNGRPGQYGNGNYNSWPYGYGNFGPIVPKTYGSRSYSPGGVYPGSYALPDIYGAAYTNYGDGGSVQHAAGPKTVDYQKFYQPTLPVVSYSTQPASPPPNYNIYPLPPYKYLETPKPVYGSAPYAPPKPQALTYNQPTGYQQRPPYPVIPNVVGYQPGPLPNTQNSFSQSKEHITNPYTNLQFFRGYPVSNQEPQAENTYAKSGYAEASYAGTNALQPYGNPQQHFVAYGPEAEQKLGDLKHQIYNLQGVINNLNRPEYTQKPEDKQTIYKLDQQINNLKSVVNHLNQDSTEQYESAPESNYLEVNPTYGELYITPSATTTVDASPNLYKPAGRQETRSRRKRSIAEDDPWQQMGSLVKDLFTESDGNGHEERQRNAVPNTVDIHQKLAQLKKQLDSKLRYYQGSLPPNNGNLHSRSMKHQTQPIYYPPAPTSYQPQYQYYEPKMSPNNGKIYSRPMKHQTQPIYYAPGPTTYQPQYQYHQPKNTKIKLFDKLQNKKESKKAEITAKIIEKIVDKMRIAIPIIIKALFGVGVDEVVTFANSAIGQDGYDYGNYGVQQTFQTFGLSGYIPVIIIKVLTKLGYFVKLLQKNKFIKYFLIPALMTAGVAGLVVFLVWWLTSEDQNGYGYGYSSVGYGTSYNNGDYSDNYGEKSSYGNFCRTASIIDYPNSNARVRGNYNNNNNYVPNSSLYYGYGPNYYQYNPAPPHFYNNHQGISSYLD